MGKKNKKKPVIHPDEVIYIQAIEEFERLGEVTSARCARCGELITIQETNRWTRVTSCKCGRYNGTLKGLRS